MKCLNAESYKLWNFIKTKKSKILLFSVILIIILVLVLVSNLFYPSLYNSQVIKFDDKSKQYENIFNYSLKKDEFQVTLNEIYSDSTITYVWLTVDGDFSTISQNGIKGLDYNFMLSYIDNAWIDIGDRKLELIDNNLSNDNLNKNNDIILDAGNNNDTSVILVFKGGIERTGNISFSIKIHDIQTPFTFSDLNINAPQVVVKNINNQIFEGDFGSANLKKVTFTPIRTIFDIEWIICSEKKLNSFFIDYDTYYVNGEKEGYFTSPYPSEYKDDGKNRINQFVLNESFDPYKRLEIRLVENNQTTKIKDFFIIE